MDHERFMRMALRLARRGGASPNPMVGAVIVKDGEVVGRGFHPKAGESHAEVFALLDAREAARGATLYVNLEPCSHYGRTPPCADAVIAAGIVRVVAAMQDPDPRVSGNGFRKLREAGIDVMVGVLERQAAEMNEAYLKHIATGMPFVTLKMAMTLDGKIASHQGDSRWISGEQSRCVVHKLRARVDAVLIGAGAAIQDDPLLTARHGTVAKQPARVVVDEVAALSLDSRILQEPGGEVIVATTCRADPAKIGKLEAAGARILILDEVGGLVDLPALFRELDNMGIINILAEGGGELSASLVNARLVDKVLMFIAPKIIGGRAAKTPVEGEGTALMSEALPLTDIRVSRCGEDLVVTGRPDYGDG